MRWLVPLIGVVVLVAGFILGSHRPVVTDNGATATCGTVYQQDHTAAHEQDRRNRMIGTVFDRTNLFGECRAAVAGLNTIYWIVLAVGAIILFGGLAFALAKKPD